MEQKQEIKKDKINEEKLVRILSKDIRGNMTLYSGLAKIKGISWSFSNAVCKKMGIDKKRTIGSLSREEINKITEFIRNPSLPKYVFNRQKDFDTGEDKHLTGGDLELRKDFDIKRLRKIKSYRGLRHASNLPLRGKRTKGHFRHNRKKGGGIKKKNKE